MRARFAIVLALVAACVWLPDAGSATAAGGCPAGTALSEDGTTCSVTFAQTGSPQTFTVPTRVSSLSVVADGAEGGGGGGMGGQESGTVAVSSGQSLTVIVGAQGQTAPTNYPVCGEGSGQGGYGGGGDGGGGYTCDGNAGGSGGGGGSFVFGPGGSLLLAAGGGGGVGGSIGPPFGYGGGSGGSGGGTDGGTGGTAYYYPPSDAYPDGAYLGQGGTGAGAGGPGQGGASGSGPVAQCPGQASTYGDDGTGPASSVSELGGGGDGGSSAQVSGCQDFTGGGGGGGGYDGGGGGGGDSYEGAGGGGGSGYAAVAVTGAEAEQGMEFGDGQVTISFPVPPPGVQITTTSLPPGAVGYDYSATLAAQSGTPPYTWSLVSGSLPDGLSLDGASGVISGEPTELGTFDFTVQVADAADPATTDTAALSIEIDKLAVTSVSTCHVTSPSASCSGGQQDGAPGCTNCAEGGYNGGVLVTVSGVGFLEGGAPSVSLVLGDGTILPAQIQGSASDTQLRVLSPAITPGELSNGEAAADVIVTSGPDHSSPSPATDTFTYVPPTVTSVTPGVGSFTQGTPVYVHGIGLAGTQVIALDPTAANPSIPAQYLSAISNPPDKVTITSTGDDTVTFTAPSFNSFGINGVTQSVFFDMRAGVPFSLAEGQSAESSVNNPTDVFEYQVGAFAVTVMGDHGATPLDDSQHLFSDDTLKISGSGFDPSGGPITLQVDDQPSISVPAAATFNADLDLKGWRSRDAQGCHATLTAEQDGQSVQVPLTGQPESFIAFLDGSMSAPISGEPIKSGDPICQGESTLNGISSILGPFSASGIKALILDSAANTSNQGELAGAGPPGTTVSGAGGAPVFQADHLGGTAITNLILAPDNGISILGIVAITSGARLCVQYEDGAYVTLTSNGADAAVDSGSEPVGPGENVSTGRGLCPAVRNRAPSVPAGDLDATEFNPLQSGSLGVGERNDGFLDSGELTGVNVFARSVFALRGLVENDAEVYVNGSILATASVRGTGALIAARDITVTGKTEVETDQNFALFADGDTDLLGEAAGVAGGSPHVLDYHSSTGLKAGVDHGPPPYWQLDVPPGALPDGTQIGVYSTPEFSDLQQQLPPGQSYLAGLTVYWADPAGEDPDATHPVTLTITDPKIQAGDTIYIWTATGLQQADAVVTDGRAVITFTGDPTFIVAQRSKARLRLRAVTTRAAHACAVKLRSARAAEAGPGTCEVTATLAGTIDRLADGGKVKLRLHQGAGAGVRSASARIRAGRFRFAIKLRLASLTTQRWTFTVAYAGDRGLRPATVSGGFTLAPAGSVHGAVSSRGARAATR